MIIKLEICTDNAAFDDCAALEVSRIIGNVAERIANEGLPEHLAGRTLFDINGNTVGDLTIERPDTMAAHADKCAEFRRYR